MAQALYNEHPLDEYLKESGDKHERLPGSFSDSSDEDLDNMNSTPCVDISLPTSSLIGTLDILRHWSSTLRHILPSPLDDFAERFKYDLISSNLLSTSVTPSPISTHPRASLPSPHHSFPGELSTPQQDATIKSEQELKTFSSAFVFMGMAALFNQYRFAAAIALLTSISFAKAPGATALKHSSTPQMFESLEALKTAGIAWDTAVNDAITIIEREERSVYYTPSASMPATSTSALRISLHSTLLTTQNQCDNVRPLLAALASPEELAQLSEMYAPSTPVKLSYNLQSGPSPRRSRKNSVHSETDVDSPRPSRFDSDKRQTWSGYNLSPNAGNRTLMAIKKRERRRSDMFSLLNNPSRSSSPTLKPPHSPSLAQVMEADEDQEHSQDPDISISVSESDLSQDVFGTAALHLRRKRRASGAEVFGITPSRSVPSLRDSISLSSRDSLTSNRFTSLSTSRHHLSLSALHQVLHGALASRRYACAHLLALRFKEDAEDDTYWENVRSVTSLLTSTLEDAASRLNEALFEADKLSRQEGEPTPESSPDNSPLVALNKDLVSSDAQTTDSEIPKTPIRSSVRPSEMLDLQLPSTPITTSSFAPMPSGVSRFASHVDTIASSLNDANEQLLECVEELRNELRSGEGREARNVEASEQGVLDTYERLRRELGLALRECERGKAALTDIFETRRQRNQPPTDIFDDDERSNLPYTGRVRKHTESGSSKDSGDLGPFTPEEGSPVIPTFPSLASVESESQQEREIDDATQHLLLSTSSEHLPPAGLEQVFEAESAISTPFTRERSKLSREERIKIMRAKRDSMTGRGLAAQLENEEDDSDRSNRPGWGPGTDVVEELKDVIWKVGERRRKMRESSLSTPTPTRIPRLPNSSASDDYDTSLCTS